MNLSLWSSLPKRKRRNAEEAALLNWDNPELLKFAKNRRDALNRKKTLRNEYGHTYARMSLKTGIILTEDQLEHFSENAHLFDSFLLAHPLYRKYVLYCANEIWASPPPADEHLAQSAMKIFFQVRKLKRSIQYCPKLICIVPVSFFSNSEKMALRLVCKDFANLFKSDMRMQVRIEGHLMLLPLSTTTACSKVTASSLEAVTPEHQAVSQARALRK